MEQFLEEKGHTLTEKAIGCNAEENAFMSGKGHITTEMARWIRYMVPELTIDFINAYDFHYMKYLKSLLVKASNKTPHIMGKTKRKLLAPANV